MAKSKETRLAEARARRIKEIRIQTLGNRILDRLMTEPVKTENFTPLTRDECHERSDTPSTDW